MKKLALLDITLILIVISGFLLRGMQYAIGRSLWLDEAWLALNIINRSFAGLFQPLDYQQGAPIGFLLTQKLFVVIFGNHDYILRFFPFLCGSAALILFAFLVRKVLNPAGAIIALILFAWETRLIYYASEAKQYSTDVLATAIILFLAIDLLSSEKFNPQKAYLFSILSAGLLFFSHPALFIVSGASAAIVIHLVRKRETRSIVHFLTASIIWLGTFALLYAITLRGLSSNQFLLDFWSEGFAPHDLTQIPAWFAKAFNEMIPLAWGENIRWLLFVFFLTGLGSLWARRSAWGVTITIILILVVAASFLNKYPFWGRMILFLQPIMALGLGESLDLIQRSIRKPFAKRRRIALALSSLFILIALLPHFEKATENATSPKMQEHIKPSMEYLQSNREPDELIYLYHGAVPAFTYYAPFYGIDMQKVIIGTKHAEDFSTYRTELESLPKGKRVWVLFSHVFIESQGNEKDFMFGQLKEMGEKKREFRIPGTSVFLYLFALRR